jgi:glucokinase
MSEPVLYAGTDLGGTKIFSVVADADGNILGEDRRQTEPERGVESVIERIAASVRDASDRAGAVAKDLIAVGISTPGPCDPQRGVVTNAPNLAGWRDVPLLALVQEALALPAVMENDANAAAYGELCFGAGRGLKHLVYVTLGTGIGGGIIVDGKIYEGASGAAGEVGHLILDPDGPPCNCGSRGCLEALSAGPAIARAAEVEAAAGRSESLAQLVGDGVLTAELVHRAAQDGDAAARGVIERAGRFLGLGLAGLLNVFNPQALVLGGGLVALGDLYLGRAIETARHHAFDQVVQDVMITTAKLGEHAGALGAAALVMGDRSR